ncbi:LuxR C-terminal-related transcriptional regulator [Cohnella cholangitidis]|uniref:LuxR family transcriptional regulator n=1 Tax=Cohnella cholangitidis TaxID=2598458 RepID=A0A7G5BUQ4_9BACL|nr:LuxR C-terminal-related transcriptional regulator [Cohnella cholangitidis]QMV40688.1 LuxR family transcriptional regulator [Cohnella cholangitidis]
MITPILSTKLYLPPTRSEVVRRPRLTERLNAGLYRKLTLVSASAGFGKTTMVSEWLNGFERPVAWVSLDEGDNDAARFLTYLFAALQTIGAKIGESVFGMLGSSHSPPIDSILTIVLNEIDVVPQPFVLVLDDYHVIEAKPVDEAVAFLLEHLPKQMHLVIATREDPRIPLARLRSRNQLTELRVADLRFTPSEAAGFLNQTMNLNLSSTDIELLETRTEGWIAGLQLAAISMQGHKDTAGFIQSFTGSHRFVLDYLVEEVLRRQSASVQNFLLRTAILDRLCGPLCDAVLRLDCSSSGQETLEYLERANLFIVPLDNERRWYRYHHLFAELLLQRLHQSIGSSSEEERKAVAGLHVRASAWYEDNGLEVEAFRHAVAANDIDRAARLMEGEGLPLHFRGVLTPVLNWLGSLPASVLDERPSLGVMHASVLLMAGQLASVEQKLQAAEAVLERADADDKTHDLIGHIASIRATVAVSQHRVETIIAQSQRALEYLHPANLPVRTATTWTLGYAYQLQGNRTAAIQAYTEVITISEAIGHVLMVILATTGLGGLQEADNQLESAAQTYRSVLQLAGEPPLPAACEAHLGLARIYYEWNDINAAEQHGRMSVQLARQLEHTDRFIACEVFLARLKLAQGDVSGAAAIIAKADRFARHHNFVHRLPDIASVHVLTSLRQGNFAEAARLAQTHELPLSEARVCLAQGDSAAALSKLGALREQAENKGWVDVRLKATIVQAIALHAHGDMIEAVRLLGDALAMAEPNGFIRLFVDEGTPMARLLSETAAQGSMSGYIGKLLAAFAVEEMKNDDKSLPRRTLNARPLIEPLSDRELEVLQLIALGLSNREISERLCLALSSVKGHNQNIFGKLQVQRRTEAVARARQLGLL